MSKEEKKLPVLPAGQYRLTKTVKNPSPDKRRTRSLSAAPIFDVGMTFIVRLERYELDSGRGYAYNEVLTTWEDALSLEQRQAVVPHLEPAEPTVLGLFILHRVTHNHPYAFAQACIDQGVLTIEQVDAVLRGDDRGVFETSALCATQEK